MTIRKLILLLVGLFASVALMAQNHNVTIKLVDALSGEPVGFATVSLTPEKGSVKYALSNHEGTAVVEKVRSGKYTLKAEILGYKPYSAPVEVSGNTDLGSVRMELDQEILDAASVSAVGNPVIIKKDTVEYNASSFKISDDNMLVDLLKKLPGIEVDENGAITSNGETISKITIGGKTFFLDDPQLASQNIPAKLVEKVKVVKKKSEQAEFTGIDDGEDETIIDLSIQKGMMNGLFGNAMAGGGHDLPSVSTAVNDFRWQGAFMGGKFTESSQISVIANANNTNNRGFNDLSGSMMNSMMGGGGGMGRGRGGWGGGSNGITTSWMAGVNGNWDLLDKKMELGSNYLYNGSVVDVLENTYKETYMTDGSTLVSDNDGMSTRFTDGHRFGVRLEHKFSENTSILFQPQFNFGRGNYVQQSGFGSYTFGEGDPYREMDPATYQRFITNNGFTSNYGENTNWETRGFLLLRQRLGIPGRTLSVNVDWNLSDNTLDGYTQSLTDTQFDAAGVPVPGTATVINQRVDQKSRSRSAGSRIVYTEPLGGNFYVEGSYNIRWAQSNTDKLTYESGIFDWTGISYDEASHRMVDASGKSLDLLPFNNANYDAGRTYDAYSNSIVNRSLNQTMGLAFMYQNEGLRAQLGASAIPTRTYNETFNFLKGQADIYDPETIWNFSPRAMLFYDFNDNSNIRLFYFGRSSQPSTRQLNPVLDNSNPLSLSLGNPYLNPYFNHTLRSDIEFSKRQAFFTLRVHLEGGMTQNPITNASWYDPTGRAYSFPVNGHNTYNGSMRIMINAPIARSGFSVSNMTNASYSRTGSFIGAARLDMEQFLRRDADGNLTAFDYAAFQQYYFEDNTDRWATDFLDNTTRSLNVTERLRLTYRNDNLEVITSGRTRVSKPWYTIQTAVAATWNNQVSASVKWTFGSSGVELGTDANYNWFNGYTTPQAPQLVWNATASVPLFRRQATLSLKAYDLLDQANNLLVSTTDNYYQETVNNTLGRYVILSLTWRFGNFGKAGDQFRSRMGGGMGRGGMGRGGWGGGGMF